MTRLSREQLFTPDEFAIIHVMGGWYMGTVAKLFGTAVAERSTEVPREGFVYRKLLNASDD